MPHGLVPGREVHPADGADPVGQTGALGVLGQNQYWHVRINGTHLLQNGLQNGIISSIAPAVGAADDHAVPVLLGTIVSTDDLLIDMQLSIHCFLDGELGGGLFVELLAHAPAQLVVIAESCQMGPQGLPVSGREEIAVHVLVDEIGDAAHGGSYGGQVEAGTLGQRIGECF